MNTIYILYTLYIYILYIYIIYIYIICLTCFNIYIYTYSPSVVFPSPVSELVISCATWLLALRSGVRSQDTAGWRQEHRQEHHGFPNRVNKRIGGEEFCSVIDLILNHTFCSQYVVSIMKHLHIRLDARRPLKQTRPIRRKARRKLLVHPAWVSSSQFWDK